MNDTRDRLGAGAVLCAAAALLIGPAPYRESRVSLGSLTLHGYVLVLIPALVVFGLGSARRVPTRLLAGVGPFLACFVLSCLRDPGGLSSTVKLVACVLTAVAGLALVRNEREFLWVAVAMTVSVGAAGAFALL